MVGFAHTLFMDYIMQYYHRNYRNPKAVRLSQNS